MDDLIRRQDACNELREYITEPSISDDESEIIGYNDGIELAISVLSTMPSAQLDGIPLEWIDKHLEWLDNCDNDFAQLAKVSIKAMVELWKKDRI